jgi:hypothetical protein
MFYEEDLKSAVQAGILTKETAEAFRLHVSQKQPQSVDEEHFRLITGFNDIFVVIACLLLLVSINLVLGSTSAWLGSIASAATAWGLAEFFVRKRRMAFPAIVLLIAFVAYVFTASFLLMSIIKSSPSHFMENDTINYILPAILATLAAWLHWRRFKVPITVAAGTATLVASLIALLLSISQTKALLPFVCIIAGIAVFLFAMRWDAADITRQTRKSDVAFWLHLLAAPLIIHPVFSLLGVLNGNVNIHEAIIVLLLYVGIALISLLIDRRALMVSALGYVIYVLSSVMNNLGNISLGFGLTSFIIGSALLILSAYWHQCRHFVLKRLSPGVRKYLPRSNE